MSGVAPSARISLPALPPPVVPVAVDAPARRDLIAPAAGTANPSVLTSPLTIPALHNAVHLDSGPVPGLGNDQFAVLHPQQVKAGVGLIARNAGDASSVLSMAGTALLFGPETVTRHIGKPVIAASLVAGAVDTTQEIVKWTHHEKDSGLRPTLYAATGLLPASSIMWATLAKGGLHRHNAARLAALAANVGLIGYEAATRGNDVLNGKEDASGYLAIGAAMSGVIAKAR